MAQEDVYQQFRIAEWDVRFEDWYEAYHTHNAELWHLYGHGQIDRPFLMMDRFLHPICAVKGIAKAEGEALKPLAMEMSSLFLAQTNAHFRLLPDAREVVAYLASKYALTVVSNGFAEVQHYKLEKSGLLPYFRHVVLSEEVGALKPGARIFEVAMALNLRELPYLRIAFLLRSISSMSFSYLEIVFSMSFSRWWIFWRLFSQYRLSRTIS